LFCAGKYDKTAAILNSKYRGRQVTIIGSVAGHKPLITGDINNLTDIAPVCLVFADYCVVVSVTL